MYGIQGMVAVADTMLLGTFKVILVCDAVSGVALYAEPFLPDKPDLNCWTDCKFVKYFKENPPQPFRCRKFCGIPVRPTVVLDPCFLPSTNSGVADEDQFQSGMGYVPLRGDRRSENAARAATLTLQNTFSRIKDKLIVYGGYPEVNLHKQKKYMNLVLSAMVLLDQREKVNLAFAPIDEAINGEPDVDEDDMVVEVNGARAGIHSGCFSNRDAIVYAKKGCEDYYDYKQESQLWDLLEFRDSSLKREVKERLERLAAQAEADAEYLV